MIKYYIPEDTAGAAVVRIVRLPNTIRDVNTWLVNNEQREKKKFKKNTKYN